ncbi:MAG: B-box zinc finger protein, partial [Thermodesulfobacteriota bacterium]|nr:B-box zinc finger protein [Thermodesulfobacteriota bacterium]
MQCKTHPNRMAEHFCASCGIPICNECAEEVTTGQYYCFQCAMFQTVSGVGTTLKDKRSKVAGKKGKGKKKWGPFHYFVISSSVLIAVMWGVIIFGGQKAPGGSVDFTKNKRVFLFMVDGAIKRYAH